MSTHRSPAPSDRELAALLGGSMERRGRAIVTLHAHATAVDAKDALSGPHHPRVAMLAVEIARELGWPWQRREALREAALLHDVGKIWLPEDLLQEPGPLSPAEYAQVKAHPTLGASMVSSVLSHEQASWVRHHHERWDGHGYPDRLRGDEIPEGARILGLADAWDAMTHTRIYCPRLDAEDAADECRAEAGGQFWRPAVAALLGLLFSPEASRAT